MIIFSLARGEDVKSPTFEEIYEQRFDMVYRVCFSYMKNEADTEDVAAIVFAKLLKHGTNFKNAEHEKAWLLRVAINQCKDQLKSGWNNYADIEDHKNIESANLFQESELLKTVLELPGRYKDVIYLYYYEGYSTAEVARILKKPQSTIRNQMREARKLLRDVLEEERAPTKSVCDFVGKRSGNEACESFGRSLSESDQSGVCRDEKGVLEGEE